MKKSRAPRKAGAQRGASKQPFPAGPALRRAARQARETARRFGTPIYVSRNGKIVALKP